MIDSMELKSSSKRIAGSTGGAHGAGDSIGRGRHQACEPLSAMHCKGGFIKKKPMETTFPSKSTSMCTSS